MTLLAATFLSIGCSTTVESTTTPSSEDESAPEGSAAESEIDSPSFKLGPTTVRYGRHFGPSFVREGQGGGGATNTGTATTATTVSTASSYAYGDQIRITYTNLPGNSDDWLSIAPADNNDPFYYSWWRYTKSSTDGYMDTNALDKLPPGTYVARAYFANGYDIQATSAQFTVTGTMTTNASASVSITGGQTAFTGLESVPVAYSGLEGQSWVGAYLTTGSMFSASGGWKYTPGGASGSVAFDKLYGGTWEIRAFSNDSYELQAKTAGTITVTAAITRDKPSYTTSENVVVTFGGMAGFYDTDFVAIAPAGSANTAYDLNTRQYANLEAYGTRTFSGLAAGTYVARAFNHGTAAAAAESDSFIIQ